MSSVANLQPEPATILACTVSRDVQNFDLLIAGGALPLSGAEKADVSIWMRHKDIAKY